MDSWEALITVIYLMFTSGSTLDGGDHVCRPTRKLSILLSSGSGNLIRAFFQPTYTDPLISVQLNFLQML